MYNHKEDVDLQIQAIDARKFTDVAHMKSFTNGIENLIVGTDRGQIKVFGMPPYLQGDLLFDSFNAHLGETVKILASPDGRFVFSCGGDGTVFVYSVTEYANENSILKQEVTVSSIKEEQQRLEGSSAVVHSQLHMVVDEQLAQIVLVRKAVMELWRKKQEQLKLEMEDENNKVDHTLRTEKYNYKREIDKMDKEKSD